MRIRTIACGAAVCWGAACNSDGTKGARCGPDTVLKGDVCTAQELDASSSGGSVGAGGGTGAMPSGGVSGAATGSGGAAGGGAGKGGGAASDSGGGAGGDSNTGGGGVGGEPAAVDAGLDGAAPLGTTPFECGSRDVTGATKMSGTVSATATWSGLIHVTSDLSIRNQATITILPGTKFIVAPGARVEIGALGNDPTVIARGTPEAPILFCGETGTPGYWAGLSLHDSVRPGSVLRNVLVADGGGPAANPGTSTPLAALTVDAPVLLEGVQVRGSGSVGVLASNFAIGSRKLTVKDSVNSPLGVTGTPAIDNLPAESDLTGNGDDQVEILYSYPNASVRFRKADIPYNQKNNVSMGGAVIFGEGVEYRIASGMELRMADSTTTEGTSQTPVVFRGDAAGPHHGRLVLGPASLRYTRFEGLGGRAYPNTTAPAVSITANTPVTLDNVTASNCYFVGMELQTELSATSKAITVDRVNDAGQNALGLGARLSVGGGALLTLPSDTSFPNLIPGYEELMASGSFYDMSGTIRNLGIPYFFNDTLNIAGSSNIVLAKGTESTFSLRSVVYVAPTATFVAIGTSAEPIVLRGRVGKWAGIDSSSPNVTLSYVDVRDGGFTDGTLPGASIVARAPLTLSHSSITNSASWGLLKDASDTTDYAITNTFSGNPLGDIGTLP